MKYSDAVKAIRMVKQVMKLRARGLEYKRIDELLELPEVDGDSFSYHILREVRRGSRKVAKKS